MMKKPGRYKNMIGDGKTPNLYWLSVSNDYQYIHDENKDGMMVDWIGDLFHFESKGEMIGRFTSYSEAKQYADENFYIGMKRNGYTINRITIEDRLSGQVYEKVLEFNPLTAKTTEDEREDIGFSKREIEAKGLAFA